LLKNKGENRPASILTCELKHLKLSHMDLSKYHLPVTLVFNGNLWFTQKECKQVFALHLCTKCTVNKKNDSSQKLIKMGNYSQMIKVSTGLKVLKICLVAGKKDVQLKGCRQSDRPLHIQPWYLMYLH